MDLCRTGHLHASPTADRTSPEAKPVPIPTTTLASARVSLHRRLFVFGPQDNFDEIARLELEIAIRDDGSPAVLAFSDYRYLRLSAGFNRALRPHRDFQLLANGLQLRLDTAEPHASFLQIPQQGDLALVVKLFQLPQVLGSLPCDLKQVRGR